MYLCFAGKVYLIPFTDVGLIGDDNICLGEKQGFFCTMKTYVFLTSDFFNFLVSSLVRGDTHMHA